MARYTEFFRPNLIIAAATTYQLDQLRMYFA